MSIKIGTKIEKLSPSDTYKLMDWDDINDTAGIGQSIESLKTGQRVLESNIRMKPDGLHIEDVDNNAYDDITSLHFTGATIADVTGSDANIVIKPKITVADGQSIGNHSYEGNAIVLNGATVRPDPNDKDVILVNYNSSGSSLKLSDGVGRASDISEIKLEGADITSSNNIANIHIPFKHFADIASRDAWTTKYRQVVKYPVICLVESNEDGDTLFYKYNVAPATWSQLDVTGSASPSGAGLNISDKDLDVGLANKLDFLNGKILEDGTGGVQYTPYITYANQGGGYEMFNGKQINALPPLKFEIAKAGPNQITEDEVMLEIRHNAFERLHAPSYLTYLGREVEVVGKVNVGAKGHHDGAIWFDDVVTPSGLYISEDRNNKAYGIEEADGKDPNITGGTAYLVAFRAHMRGKAPDDGMVRAYLYNKNIDPFEPKGYLTDSNGQPLVVEKHYKAGDELGTLDVMGIVKAKALQEFSCHVVDDFSDDTLVLTDRAEGGTGLLIQALTSDEKTGPGLLQFESDTAQNIKFTSRYLGESISSIKWLVQYPMAEAETSPRDALPMADGLTFQALSNIVVGVSDNAFHFKDNGKDVCDFMFGKIFSHEETKMLAGKDLDIVLQLTNKNDAFRVGVFEWDGEPDKFTPKVFTGRNNDALVMGANWKEGGSMFIAEDPLHEYSTKMGTLTVPATAKNFAVMIYPVTAQDPMTLDLKEFQVNVSEPFIGYYLEAPEMKNESYLHFNKQFKRFTQDTQGFVSLRYTLNDAVDGLPMPCGMEKKGAADVTIDSTVNTINGSGAKGGEGAIKLQSDGEVTLSTTLRLWSEKDPSETSTVDFWFSKVSTDGNTYTKIPESETSFTVKGGTQNALYTMKTFTINGVSGDRIALRGKADKADGAFLECTSNDKPLVNIDVTFNELVTS